MPRLSLVIDGTTYTTKKSIEDQARQIRDAWSDNVPLTGDSLRWILGLLQHHPSRDEKIGVGLQSVWVQPNPEYPTTCCFCFERIDGTRDNFSFKECASPSTPEQWARAACRSAVKGQTIAFRDLEFLRPVTPVCPYRGVTLTSETCHVDHHPKTFEQLLADFLAASGLTLTEGATRDAASGTELADDSFRERWCAYHQSHAQYRLLSKIANLSDARRS